MRRVLLSSVVLMFALVPNLGNAGPRSVQIEPSSNDRASAAAPGYETYRGYLFDRPENSERRDVDAIADTCRRQLAVVQSGAVNPKVFQFFPSVPIIASEMACL